MSQFEDEMAALEATRCPTCKGSGALDDAEDGDIFYHTWTCDHCKGTGKKPEIKHEHRAAEVDKTVEVTT
jgi:DnaJ-class molecular chaperone